MRPARKACRRVQTAKPRRQKTLAGRTIKAAESGHDTNGQWESEFGATGSLG
jgi:hypothetical protein